MSSGQESVCDCPDCVAHRCGNWCQASERIIKEGRVQVTWRVGTKLLRTLYRDDVCVGMVDTPEIAAAIVEAMNAAQPATASVQGNYSLAELRRIWLMPPLEMTDAERVVSSALQEFLGSRDEAEQAVLDAMAFIAIDSVHHLANDHDNPAVRTAFRAELARRGLK